MVKTGTVYEPSEILKNAFSNAEAVKQATAARAESKALAETFKADILSSKLLQGDTTPENVEAVIQKWTDKAMEVMSGEHGSGMMNTILTAGLIIAILPFTVGSIVGLIGEKKILQPLRSKIRPELLQASEYIHAYYRRAIKYDDLVKKLATLGLSDAEQSYLLTVSEPLPSADDVIRFAVREVYTPAVAERFGQFEGAEQVYANAKDDIQNIGMSKDTFAKYWAAHWALPSINQGFEMFQRSIISRADLDLLLRSLDVVPFWRENLVKLSYNPLTRVDVRRMHKMGILTETQVYQAYKNIGYSDIDAQGLTKFTVQYNQSPEAAEETAYDTRKKYYQDLSRSDILKNYHDALINRPAASDMLVSLGYDISEADFLLDHEDYNVADTYRDSVTKYIKKLYVDGHIDKIQATTQLNSLGIASASTDLYLKTWDLDKDIKIAVPSRADIMGFLKKKIITAEVAVTELQKLGYSDTYISWYLKAQSEV